MVIYQILRALYFSFAVLNLAILYYFPHLHLLTRILCVIFEILCIVYAFTAHKEIQKIKSKKQVVKILDHILDKMKEQGVNDIKDLK